MDDDYLVLEFDYFKHKDRVEFYHQAFLNNTVLDGGVMVADYNTIISYRSPAITVSISFIEFNTYRL